MSARFLLAFAAALALVALPLSAADPKPVTVSVKLAAGPNDALAELLQKLHGEEILIEGNINEIPLFELFQRLAKQHAVTFVINEESFKAVGIQDVKTKTANLAATQLRGLTLHQFLTTVLNSVGATYLLKGKTIEIVPPEYAARATKAAIIENEEGRKSLREPLVSAVIEDKPLNEAVAAIAERYDLTVIVSQQAGDARSGSVMARLLNVPASQALELLAVQSDLRVVRRGAAFLITSREHADALFSEKIEKERAIIELDKFRQTPPPKPASPQPQAKPEQK